MKISIRTHGKSINHLAWGAIKAAKQRGKTRTWKEAFAHAIDALTIKDRLSTGIVTFTFTKLDGSLRPAKGTRSLEFIPAEFHPKGTSKKPETTNVVSFFDVENKGWKSFDITTLIPSL